MTKISDCRSYNGCLNSLLILYVYRRLTCLRSRSAPPGSLVELCDIIPCPYSDHAAVLLVCPIPVPLPRGPGRWKFNVSLLKEAAFIQEAEAFWASWDLRNPSSLLHSWWDQGKKRLKGIAIRFSASHEARCNDCRLILTSLACQLKAQIDNGCVSLLDPYESVLQRIALLDKAEAEGARFVLRYAGKRGRCLPASSCDRSVGGGQLAGFRLFVVPMALWPPTSPLSVTPGFVFILTFLQLNELTPPLKILFLVAFLLSSLAMQAALVMDHFLWMKFLWP